MDGSPQTIKHGQRKLPFPTTTTPGAAGVLTSMYVPKLIRSYQSVRQSFQKRAGTRKREKAVRAEKLNDAKVDVPKKSPGKAKEAEL